MVQRPSIIEITNNLALAAEDLRSSSGVPEFEARNTVIKEYNAATVLRNNKITGLPERTTREIRLHRCIRMLCLPV